MRRRELIHGALAAGPLAALMPVAARGAEDFPGILDCNVSLFRWPFRRLPLDGTEKLVAKLRSLGIAKALAGSFEGIFHRDLASANERLAEECSRFPELLPVASVNPALPGWRRELESAAGAVRLHPGYHGYGLDDPRFGELLAGAAARGLIVQIAVSLEDARTQPELVRVPDVDLGPLPGLLERHPGARVQLLNWKARPPLAETLAALPNLQVDIARADGTDAVAKLVETFGPDRVVFGSHAPFLVPEAALVRVHESALDEATLRSLLGSNAGLG